MDACILSNNTIHSQSLVFMGSLMAGWDSPNLDPKQVKYVRNKSLTKDEIEDFWKSKKQAVEEHLKSSYPQHVINKEEREEEVTERTFQRSNSMPLPRRNSSLPENGVQQEHRVTKTDSWWTASNSACLNEPPVIETQGHLIHKQHASFYCGHMIGKQKLVNNTNPHHHHITI